MTSVEDTVITVVIVVSIVVTALLVVAPWVVGFVSLIDWLTRVVWP